MPRAQFTNRRRNADVVVDIDARRFDVHTTELSRIYQMATYKPRKMAASVLFGNGPLLYASWDEVTLNARVDYGFKIRVKERGGRTLGRGSVRDHRFHTITVGDNFTGHTTKGAYVDAPYPNRRVARLFEDNHGNFERNVRRALMDDIGAEIAHEIRANLGFGRGRRGYMGQ